MSSTAKYVPKKKKRELKKSIVDHTYRDFSRFTAKELMGADYAGRVREGQFPAKLHDILSTGEYAHIIAWRPHGRAWAIIDKKKLIEIVMPRYFDTRKFSTFNRSINGWGFKVCVCVFSCLLISVQVSPRAQTLFSSAGNFCFLVYDTWF
jgi:hypothetical protein